MIDGIWELHLKKICRVETSLPPYGWMVNSDSRMESLSASLKPKALELKGWKA